MIASTKGYMLLMLCVSTHIASLGQNEVFQCSDSTYCIPSVRGLPRSKGIIFERESSFGQDIESKTELRDDEKSNEHIEHNTRYNVKLKVPILNKESLKMVLGLGYSNEKIDFTNPSLLTNPLLISLQERPLKTVSTGVYVLKPFKNNKYIVSRIEAKLNGDFNSKTLGYSEFLRVNAIGVYGWKLDEDRIFAFGGAFSHLFGKASILPVVLYYQTFSDRWGLEANLPGNIRMRYTPNEHHYFYGAMELSGANYRLEPTGISAPFFLEKSELKANITYEREIHDWLWTSLSIGRRYNLAFDVSSANKLTRSPGDKIINTQLDDAMYYSFGIFIVPPRKMLSK